MPIKNWIEKDKKRVRSIVSGSITMDEILHAINGSINDPEFVTGFDILSDHTEIETAITSEQVQMTADHLKALSTHFTGSKWAVVTVMELSYGMMRMFSVFLEEIPIHLRVFRTIEEAEEWLEQDS